MRARAVAEAAGRDLRGEASGAALGRVTPPRAARRLRQGLRHDRRHLGSFGA